MRISDWSSDVCSSDLFEPLRAGSISLGNMMLSDNGCQVEPEDRHVGMMFQDYALFPHLSVEKNIAFGLRKWDKQRRRDRVHELLSLTGLEASGQRYPHERSEEHTSELQSLMRISYAVFRLQKKQ